MGKMSIRVILKSGNEFTMKCDEFTANKNVFGQFIGYSAKGISENKPIYLDIEQVSAIIRIMSDEEQTTALKTDEGV